MERTDGTRSVLVVLLTFCINGVISLPLYSFLPAPAPAYYSAPPVDPYGLPYPVPDPYAVPQPQPYIVNYQPSTPAYIPSVDAYYQVPQPSQPPYTVDPYQPQPSAYPTPSPNYALAPSIPQYLAPTAQPSSVVDIYQAITFHTIQERQHCGVVQATNNDIYSPSTPGGINDVAPFGAYPWLQFLVDNDDSSVVCIASRIATGLAIVPTSCINGPASKYSLTTDWDILTIYNQYEPYKSSSTPVCSTWPLDIDTSSDQVQYKLGGPNAELTLIATTDDEDLDKYPHIFDLCLPQGSSSYPPLTPPAYQSPYGYPQPPSVYTPYPSYPQIAPAPAYLSNTECWVVGYRNSITAILQNHPLPTSVDSYPGPPSNVLYYNNIDNSKVPRRALVRQINCPGNPYPSPNDVCFVGVEAYDACVADKGTPVFCIVDDNSNYESGFVDDPTSDHGAVSPGPSNSNYPPYQGQQKQPIQALTAPPKLDRMRAVMFAIVKTPTTCTAALTAQQQSNYIVATKVSSTIRAVIVDFQWMYGADLTCPSEKLGDVLSQPPSGSSALAPIPYAPSYTQSGPYSSSSIQPQLYDPSITIDPYYQQLPQYQAQPSYPQPPPYQVPDPLSYTPSYPQPPPYQVPDPVSYTPSYYPQYQQPSPYQVPDPVSYSQPPPPYSVYQQPSPYQVPDPVSYSQPPPPYSVYEQPSPYQVPDPVSYSQPPPQYSVYEQPSPYQVPDPVSYSQPPAPYSVYQQPPPYQVPDPVYSVYPQNPAYQDIYGIP